MSELTGSDRNDWLLQPLRRVRDFGKVPTQIRAEEDENDAKPKKVSAAQGMSSFCERHVLPFVRKVLCGTCYTTLCYPAVCERMCLLTRHSFIVLSWHAR